MFEKLQKSFFLNPLDRLCIKWKKENKRKILVLWNRGLGDIPLWLYGLCYQIRKIIPDAQISFLTRETLAEAFTMLEEIEVLVSSRMKRGDKVNLTEELEQLGRSPDDYDVILEKIEPKKWLKWQRGLIIPRLKWKINDKALIEKFGLGTNSYVAVHLSSETSSFYDRERNWPLENFKSLFEKIKKETSLRILLFGFQQTPVFHDDIIDLRGKTTFFEMLAIMKNNCSHLIAPDSGVLCSIYYLDEEFPLSIISLWGNPRQGILRQKVLSPNKKLRHNPLIGKKKEVKNIVVKQVFDSLQKS